MHEHAHFQRSKASVGRIQAQTTQGEPFVRAFKIAFHLRSRQRCFASSRPRINTRDHDVFAPVVRDGSRRPLLYRQDATKGRRRTFDCPMRLVFATGHDERKEGCRHPVRPVEVVVCRNVLPVAVQHFLEHDARVLFVRVDRVERAREHQALARNGKHAREPCARLGKRTRPRRNAKALEQCLFRSALRAHRVVSGCHVGGHKSERAARRKPSGGPLVADQDLRAFAR